MFMLHHAMHTPVDNAIVEATTFSELPGPITVVPDHGTATTALPARRLVHLR